MSGQRLPDDENQIDPFDEDEVSKNRPKLLRNIYAVCMYSCIHICIYLILFFVALNRKNIC